MIFLFVMVSGIFIQVCGFGWWVAAMFVVAIINAIIAEA